MGKRNGKIIKSSPKGIYHLSYPRLLPLKQAAEWLGLSTWAMRERIWAGDIPVVQFPGGRKQYIDVHDLDEFIRKNKRWIT